MKLDVLPEKQRAATWRKRDGSVADLRLLRLVERVNVFCLRSSKARVDQLCVKVAVSVMGPPMMIEAGLLVPEKEPVPLPVQFAKL